jgi:hypothetical protein
VEKQDASVNTDLVMFENVPSDGSVVCNDMISDSFVWDTDTDSTTGAGDVLERDKDMMTSADPVTTSTPVKESERMHQTAELSAGNVINLSGPSLVCLPIDRFEEDNTKTGLMGNMDTISQPISNVSAIDLTGRPGISNADSAQSETVLTYEWSDQDKKPPIPPIPPKLLKPPKPPIPPKPPKFLYNRM